MKSNVLILLIVFIISLLGIVYLNQSSLHYESFENYAKVGSISKYYEIKNSNRGLYDHN